MIMNDEVNVFFACNDRYVDYLYSAINSMMKNTLSPERVKIHVLYSVFAKETMEVIRELADVDFIEINDSLFDQFPRAQNSGKETYYRYLIPVVFPYAKKCIYLDCDVVFKGDVCDLWALDLRGNMIGASEDVYEYMKGNKQHLGMTSFYFNAGVLLFDNGKWRENDMALKLFQANLELLGKISWADQDVLNLVFHNRTTLIPAGWNITTGMCEEFAKNNVKGFFYSRDEVEEALANPKLIHYTGIKPHENGCTHSLKGELAAYQRTNYAEKKKT
jgi:lipopolysaccharide biosynthesis glycosyltransferase